MASNTATIHSTRGVAHQQYRGRLIPRVVTDFGPHDVFMGRDSVWPAEQQQQQGNERFRDLLRERRHDYLKQNTRRGKSRVCKDIIKIIHGRGGRFLELVPADGDTWMLVDDAAVLNQRVRQQFMRSVGPETRKKRIMQRMQSQEASFPLGAGGAKNNSDSDDSLLSLPKALPAPKQMVFSSTTRKVRQSPVIKAIGCPTPSVSSDNMSTTSSNLEENSNSTTTHSGFHGGMTKTTTIPPNQAGGGGYGSHLGQPHPACPSPPQGISPPPPQLFGARQDKSSSPLHQQDDSQQVLQQLLAALTATHTGPSFTVNPPVPAFFAAPPPPPPQQQQQQQQPSQDFATLAALSLLLGSLGGNGR